MRDTWLIAKREYLEQVRGKAFRITTILIPVIFAAVIAISFVADKYSGSGKHFTVAANNATLAEDVREQLLTDKDADLHVDILAPAADTDRQKLVDQVSQKQIDGFLWLVQDANGQTAAVYAGRSSGDFSTASRLSESVDHAILEQQLTGHGVASTDATMLTKGVKIKTRQVRDGKEVDSSTFGTFIAAYVMAFLLTFTVMMYGMNVGRSVIQEKTSRIFEVMLSTVEPRDMLAGKLIGIGAVGLTQLAIWAAAAGIFLSTALAATLMTGEFQIHISLPEVILFGVYFLLGYALYSTLFAGLAATCESEQELQQYAPLAAVPVWLSFSMITFIMSNPNSFWSVVVSLFPPCAPIAMFLRIASQFPPLWQIAVSLILLLLSVVFVVWFSSRIYRIGILMYGKRATLPEIFRWLRYS
ncbi:ABC transporter permease [Alloacidobacterium dinghuense]|uniref:ABC transporter permease n=1 Tax=Alloacidobacterium dinghuense TaxID=2763107 RepID=A0A7G8BL52_9BACT|nr:ABC transporter permease [Alloacidobacterium dinghuense]QNI33272.1 ABC transporter permease [Alloacidobacterium dinghuense]